MESTDLLLVNGISKGRSHSKNITSLSPDIHTDKCSYDDSKDRGTIATPKIGKGY